MRVMPKIGLFRPALLPKVGPGSIWETTGMSGCEGCHLLRDRVFADYPSLNACKSHTANSPIREAVLTVALSEARPGGHAAVERGMRMHDDRGPAEMFRPPVREPKPGTFHRPAHGVGIKRIPEPAQLKLTGPMSGEQSLGEGFLDLPLGGNASAARTKDQA
jgi:hypothetical protein